MSVSDESIWDYKKRKGCTCPIEPGMSFFQLRALGSGCGGTGVCTVLDRYRQQQSRKVSDDERVADDLATAKLVGWKP